MKRYLPTLVLIILLIIPASFGCKNKHKKAEFSHTTVTVKIDYLSTGGLYHDDIESIPYGLTTGTNGPYPISPDESYNIEYLPEEGWSNPVRLQQWSPAEQGNWVIHCYVAGNMAYIKAYRE